MILDRPDTDAEFVGDLAAGFVFGDHAKDLSLGRRERVDAVERFCFRRHVYRGRS